MKQSSFRKFMGVTATSLALVLLAACSGGESGDESAEPADQGDSGDSLEATDFKVAALLTGTENDGGISQAFVEGMKLAEEKHGVEIRTVGPVTSTDEVTQQGAAFASEDFDMVIVHHSGLTEPIPDLAEQFPDTIFCAYWNEGDQDALDNLPENACYYDSQNQYGSFMGGVAAALASKTGHIGAIGGMDIPLAANQPEGFYVGAKCVDPDIRIDETFTGDFNDPAKARSAAESIYGSGADIILAAVDAAIQGILTVAEAEDSRYVVAQYYDNYDSAPDVILTSALYGLDQIALELIEDGMAGTVESQYLFDDKFSLADFREHADLLGEEGLAKVEEIQDKLLSGEITLPPIEIIGKGGAGAQIDVSELGC